MKLHLSFCPPLIRTVEGQVRFARLLLRLPFVHEVSCRVFRRRDIRRIKYTAERWDV